MRLSKFRNSVGQEFTIQVFLSGDYEFLCHMYGLSGASGVLNSCTYNLRLISDFLLGRHCCLWCTIKGESLKLPREVRGRSTPRTLSSIKSDYERFCANGSDIKKAKHFNNVIDVTFFDVELDQVLSSCKKYNSSCVTIHFRFAYQACTLLWEYSFISSLYYKTSVTG